MTPLSFYPGPSRVYSRVPEYVLEAYSGGIMSINHRSKRFRKMVGELREVLFDRQGIPSDYSVIFTSSATECWEIIAQSLTRNESQHFFNGAFGAKWHAWASRLTNAKAVSFDMEDTLPVHRLSDSADVVCLTQNETSNGSQVSREFIATVRSKTDALIAVDAVSSMGGLAFDYSQADVWFASVQKCFGLPAGMGLMVLSPRAVARAEELADRERYNSLLVHLDNWSKNEAPYTPNVLGLYLLLRSQKNAKPIVEIEKKLVNRHADWVEYLSRFADMTVLPVKEELRSTTVLAVTCPDPKTILSRGNDLGIHFGKGYGPWQETTFRIANFPAIKRKEIDKAQKFLRSFC